MKKYLKITSLKSLIISIGIVILFVAIDLVTKHIAFANYELHHEYQCIPGVIRFSLVLNEGSAFGILQGQWWLLTIISIVALIIFAFIFKDVDLKERPIFTACFILIVAGTIGNFADRLFLGSVRDFITFDFMSYPSFNFADMCMCVGVFVLIFDIIMGETGKRWS